MAVNARINTRKPASYITGRAYISGFPFYVDERVIVPRSLIGEVLLREEGFSPPGAEDEVSSVLDLCTGSGCLAIIAAQLYSDAAVDAVDLSADALEVARRNVREYELEDRINLFNGNLFEPVANRKYDLIITNPPYVDAEAMAALPDEYRHEPEMALAAGEDGLDIVRKIIEAAPEFLTETGGLICEIGKGKELLESEYPHLPFLWLETATTEGAIFWITGKSLSGEK